MTIAAADRMARHSIIPGGPLDLLQRMTRARAIADYAKCEATMRKRLIEAQEARDAFEAYRLRTGYYRCEPVPEQGGLFREEERNG